LRVGQTTLRAPLSLHTTEEAEALDAPAALELAGASTPSRETSMPASATTTADRFATLFRELDLVMTLTPSNFGGPIPFHLLVRWPNVPQTEHPKALHDANRDPY
jgi:hypothetical protein